jgi:hypothetical protein
LLTTLSLSFWFFPISLLCVPQNGRRHTVERVRAETDQWECRDVRVCPEILLSCASATLSTPPLALQVF